MIIFKTCNTVIVTTLLTLLSSYFVTNIVIQILTKTFCDPFAGKLKRHSHLGTKEKERINGFILKSSFY